MDLVSMEILMRDIAALYKDENLPLLQLQYKDFSQWQNNLLQSETIKKQEVYWLDRFKGKLPDITIAADYPRPGKRSTEGDRVDFTIDGPLYQRLDKLALQTEATIYMILMAAVNILIAMYTDLEDIIIGFPTAGRSHTELENVLGMFVNMLPLRNFPAPGKTVAAFLNEVKRNLLEAYENQDYLFEDLVTKLKIKRDLSKNPLFDFVFAMDSGDSALPETGDFLITAESYAKIDSAARFDLTLFARPFEKGLTYSLRYSTALYKKETIERTVTNFKEILSQVAENPGIKLEEIQISRYSSKADDLSDEDAVDFNF
jgi:non-ribosomal peptide synthetase component F